MATTIHSFFGFAALLSTTFACSATPVHPLTSAGRTLQHREAVECEGGSVRTSSDANRFYACEVIRGDLAIEGTALRELGAFANVRRVSGTLTIAQNAALESLAKLGRLRSAASIVIEQNPLLVDAHGLEGLVSVERLELIDNGFFRTAGLEQLKSVGALVVTHNENLVSLAGLNGLEHAGSVELSENPRLCASLGLLPNLASVPGELVVRDNAGVSTTDAAELVERAKPSAVLSARFEG